MLDRLYPSELVLFYLDIRLSDWEDHFGIAALPGVLAGQRAREITGLDKLLFPDRVETDEEDFIRLLQQNSHFVNAKTNQRFFELRTGFFLP